MKIILVSLISALLSLSACNKEKVKNDGPDQHPSDTFAKGADVSWLTEMEDQGILFYDRDNNETECMTLLKGLGMNSIRLRVWVNPAEGWNSKADVLIKAKRANDLGLRLMIDFHYSDSWADPGKQYKPAAWESLSFNDLKSAIADHTRDILNALKDQDIYPEWVQVGNETGNGMLWNDGKASSYMGQYASLSNAGYHAVKEVFPTTKVIVHLQNGQDNSLYRWLFDGMKNTGGKWDVIGMSLYPPVDQWQSYNNACISNINDMIARYGKEVMICEVGMPWDAAATAKLWLTDLITRSQGIEKCLGVFYWEPEAHNGWKGYTLGAFDNSGKPTVALDAFGNLAN